MKKKDVQKSPKFEDRTTTFNIHYEVKLPDLQRLTSNSWTSDDRWIFRQITAELRLLMLTLMSTIMCWFALVASGPLPRTTQGNRDCQVMVCCHKKIRFVTEERGWPLLMSSISDARDFCWPQITNNRTWFSCRKTNHLPKTFLDFLSDKNILTVLPKKRNICFKEVLETSSFFLLN